MRLIVTGGDVGSQAFLIPSAGGNEWKQLQGSYSTFDAIPELRRVVIAKRRNYEEVDVIFPRLVNGEPILKPMHTSLLVVRGWPKKDSKVAVTYVGSVDEFAAHLMKYAGNLEY